ncbi:MAG: SPASM domain-containing protein [Elusimicrobiota bacterium]
MFKMMGCIDSPAKDGQVVGSAAEVTGWMAGEAELASLRLLVNGRHAASMGRGLPRPDVAKSHPCFASAARSGFSHRLNTRILPNGPHTLAIEGVTPDGLSLTLERTFIVRNTAPPRALANHSLLLEDLAGRRSELRSRPTKIFIEPTKLCNLSCIMCRSPQYLHQLRRSGETIGRMPWEAFAKIIPVLGGASSIIPTGWGEAFTHPDFTKMLSTIRRHNRTARIAFNTNAQLLGDKEAACLIDNEVQAITVSVDSPHKTNYEFIRRGARFDRMVRNIDRLIRLREKRGTRYPEIVFEFVVMGPNILDMPAFVEFAAKFKPAGIVFVAIGGVRPEGEHLRLREPRPYLDIYRDTKRLAARHGILLKGTAVDIFESFEHEPPRTGTAAAPQAAPAENNGRLPALKCYEPFQTAFLNCAGEVTPCCFAATSKMGDLRRQSFDEIWNGDRYRAFRKSFYADEPPNEACRRCLELGQSPSSIEPPPNR